tara:strand:+ start:150 stop:1118 length:969 start_codon:yes stop_codon:yes gene_type:complete
MKVLTILIFSGDDRLDVKYLLKDLASLNQSNTDIRVVEWSENKKNLLKKKNIYHGFRNKIKNFKVYYHKGNWEYKYSKFVNKFNSKYILLIGDDDRINVKNFRKIYKYLDYNFSGITLSFINYNKKKDLKIKQDKTLDQIRSFNLEKDFNRIGFTSCQIMNVKFVKKIFKTEKKYLLKTKFPQNFVTTKLIKKYGNWQVLELPCIFNCLRSFDNIWIRKNLLIRLKSEYLGYFIPIKKYFSNLSSEKVSKIYTYIFLKNIISWLFLSIKHFGKTQTFKNIKKERQILNEPLLVKLILIFIYLCPFFLLDILRIFRRKFLLKL